METSLNVLIVEDEIIIGETIKIYLQAKGHTVQDICISYEEAIRALSHSSQTIDIALIDIRLYGEKSGIDLALYLKHNYPHLPYIFLTSQYDKRIVNYAMQTKPMGYLAKPIRKEALWSTVEDAYNKSK